MEVITVKTHKKVELIDITEEVVKRLPPKDGICVLYVPHTTAGIIINEGADPSVKEDLIMAFERIAPENLPYKHLEGNSPGHVKSSLTGPSLTFIVEKGKPVLGTWQRIFFAEYDGPRTRKVFLKFLEG
ncbi:YjbQ family protein [Thermodesulfobacterium sp. TA1]|uniref:secondary thiamine-phosphate synthase enzyme YjbQ n=1 Tax=Thermodesulfobacterium sp. TA1 TaxID=2234087 RepID=UPI001232A7B5|nr:secondary thiamine-phosphate synthase enzyme YjbQ [Thermodesulfobacterium sp. TA1]QER41410.1 YjbQ family protein [Thermodesulfobacterium sp. TA1]